MGKSVVPLGGQNSFILSGKRMASENNITRVAMWQIPYDKKYKEFDGDNSRWFESKNMYGDNELEAVERGLNADFSQYEVQTRTTKYNDNTYNVESTYPNKSTVFESHGKNHVWTRIRDKFNELVGEKIYNFESNEGRKTVYKNIKSGADTFTIVNVYSYDTTKNRATDIINYGYTANVSDFIKGCTYEKEYYMLNGKEIKAEKTDTGGYIVNSKDGKTLTFLVE